MYITGKTNKCVSNNFKKITIFFNVQKLVYKKERFKNIFKIYSAKY